MLTGPSSEVMRCPRQVVGHVEPILSRFIIGIVEDGEEEEFDGREGSIVVPEEERGGRIDDINLIGNRTELYTLYKAPSIFLKNGHTCILVRSSALWGE